MWFIQINMFPKWLMMLRDDRRVRNNIWFKQWCILIFIELKNPKIDKFFAPVQTFYDFSVKYQLIAPPIVMACDVECVCVCFPLRIASMLSGQTQSFMGFVSRNEHYNKMGSDRSKETMQPASTQSYTCELIDWNWYFCKYTVRKTYLLLRCMCGRYTKYRALCPKTGIERSENLLRSE